MGTIASQITSLTIVYSTVYSGADQRKHQSSASLAFVRVIHRGPANFPHKWPVTRKMFRFDDVIMRGFAVCCTLFSYHIGQNGRYFADYIFKCLFAIESKPLPEPMMTEIYKAIWPHYRPQWVLDCVASNVTRRMWRVAKIVPAIYLPS